MLCQRTASAPRIFLLVHDTLVVLLPGECKYRWDFARDSPSIVVGSVIRAKPGMLSHAYA